MTTSINSRFIRKCLVVISFIIFVNMLCLSNVYSATVNNQNDDIITLSPELVGENYKRLKGYRVHTVIWLDEYTFGYPYAQERKIRAKYEFAIHPNSKTKPKKESYVEVEATVGGSFLGFIDLNDADYISEGTQAKAVLDQIDEQEKKSKPNIESLILKADQKKQKDEDAEEQEENNQFKQNVESAKSNLKSHKNILTLLPEELKDKHSDYEGRQFHTVLTVNSVHEDYFTAKLKQSDWFDSFQCYCDWDIDLRNHLQKGDIVEITGTVKSGLFSGDDYTSCQIISIGKDAQNELKSMIAKKDASTSQSSKKTKTKQSEKNTGKEKTDNDASQKTSGVKTDESNTEFSPIERGASGESVVEIQKQLAVLGYLASSVDGKFGPATEQAIKDFQNANQLEPTGVVNKKTYDAIIAAGVTSEKQEQVSFTSIKRGDSGDSVIEVQKRLAELGYLTSSVDGKFGPGTEQAVTSFQEANSINPTGIIDKITYNRLLSSHAVHYVAPVRSLSAEDSSDNVGTRSSSDPMVWITRTGARYHSKSNCGRTKDSWQVTLSEARAKGLTPCGKCY